MRTAAWGSQPPTPSTGTRSSRPTRSKNNRSTARLHPPPCSTVRRPSSPNPVRRPSSSVRGSSTWQARSKAPPSTPLPSLTPPNTALPSPVRPVSTAPARRTSSAARTARSATGRTATRRTRTRRTRMAVTTTAVTTIRATPRLAGRNRFRRALSSRAGSATEGIRSTARQPNTATPPRAGRPRRPVGRIRCPGGSVRGGGPRVSGARASGRRLRASTGRPTARRPGRRLARTRPMGPPASARYDRAGLFPPRAARLPAATRPTAAQLPREQQPAYRGGAGQQAAGPGTGAVNAYPSATGGQQARLHRDQRAGSQRLRRHSVAQRVSRQRLPGGWQCRPWLRPERTGGRRGYRCERPG